MKSIALVTYLESPNLTDSDQLLLKPLKNLGINIGVVPWDKPEVNWKQFNSVILKSCWNYHLYFDKFNTWLSSLEQDGVSVWNPINIIRWNSKKTYLKDLEHKGIPVIPTLWINKNDQEYSTELLDKTGWNHIVVKPYVGASGYQIQAFAQNKFSEASKKISELKQNGGVMVQPLMEQIREGELSCVFISNQYSHTILKKPKQNEFRTNYEFRSDEKLIALDNHLLTQLKDIYQKLNLNLLYARIDSIVINKKLVLMELELIEPHLFFDLHPVSAEKFADAVFTYIQ